VYQGETRVRVRYQETDQMGMAYHANYLVWFEVGRTEYFRELGLPYKEFEKNNLYLPVINVYCEFRKPALYDDLLTVTTRVDSLQEVRLSFVYEVIREEETLARGNTEHAFVNHQGKPVVLRKQSPFLWKRIHEALGHGHNK